MSVQSSWSKLRQSSNNPDGTFSAAAFFDKLDGFLHVVKGNGDQSICVTAGDGSLISVFCVASKYRREPECDRVLNRTLSVHAKRSKVAQLGKDRRAADGAV